MRTGHIGQELSQEGQRGEKGVSAIGDRDFEMPKSLDIKNSEIAICDFAISS